MKKLENTIGFYVRNIRDLVLDTDKIRIVHGVLEDVVSGGCVGGVWWCSLVPVAVGAGDALGTLVAGCAGWW